MTTSSQSLAGGVSARYYVADMILLAGVPMPPDRVAALFQKAIDREAAHHSAQRELLAKRVLELESSLADMVDMSESFIKSIAESTGESRILSTPSPRLIKARALLHPDSTQKPSA